MYGISVVGDLFGMLGEFVMSMETWSRDWYTRSIFFLYTATHAYCHVLSISLSLFL